jgi:hypothetical protein
MKAPENPRSLPVRVARTVGYATAALAYLTFLVIAGADAGSVATDPIESSSRVEVAARLP